MNPGLVRLFRVTDETVTEHYGLWLLVHADLRQTARVRALIEFIADWAESNRRRFEG